MNKIEWTDQTWNPIIGCSKVSPGCDNCYAERMAKRLACMGKTQYQNVIDGYWDGNKAVTQGWNGNTNLVESALEKPLHWKKPRKIFVCSMSDLFHESVPFTWIEKVMSVIEECPQHTFQLLTKRPHIMAEYFNGLGKRFELSHLSNLWLGTTCENQEMADKRIPVLLKIPAAKRFVSVEPMLGPVRVDYYSTNFTTGECTLLDWIICGGESGPGARPMHPDWARGLRDQCKEAGVPFMFKQWGEWMPVHQTNWVCCTQTSRTSKQYGPIYELCDPKDKIIATGPTHWLGANKGDVIRVGKKKAGRLLDGVEHNEFPEVTK